MKLTTFAIVVMAGLLLSACQGDKGDMGPPGSSAPVAAPGSVQAQIDAIVAENNAYRASIGQSSLSNGLSCTVQAVASGQWLSASSPGYDSSAGTLVLSGPSYAYILTSGFDQVSSGPGPNSIIATNIQPFFLSGNYKISCTGYMVVLGDGYHSYSLSSDDGAIVTIDGTQVVNNDGQHGITTKVGVKATQSVVMHSFSMLYAQSGGGQFALMLSMDGSLLDGAVFFH